MQDMQCTSFSRQISNTEFILFNDSEILRCFSYKILWMTLVVDFLATASFQLISSFPLRD